MVAMSRNRLRELDQCCMHFTSPGFSRRSPDARHAKRRVACATITALETATVMAHHMHHLPYGGRMREAEDARAGHARELEAALRQTEAGFREFIDRCPDAVFVRRDRVVLHANDALLKLLGFERNEVEGSDPAKVFVHPCHRESVLEHRAHNPDGTDLREHRWVRKNGEVVDVEVVGVTVMFEGMPARICMCRDLTERKRMQSKLLVAGHMASIGTLAAGIAHEINTPLSHIVGNLRLIAKDLQERVGDSKESREMIAGVLDGAERVKRIVEGLNTFSRSDDGRRVNLELPRVIDAAVELASSEIHDRARLVRDYQEVGRVNANESRLVQVIVNLLVNAARAIPEGHAKSNEIRVETRACDPGRAMFAIRDTGVGIPPERLSRVFDPFFTTKIAGEGAGLGLSICHNIVTGLGGEITVESRAGFGTTFMVILPVTQPPSGRRRG
jgi:two-component system, NtrC family, sensor kinase